MVTLGVYNKSRSILKQTNTESKLEDNLDFLVCFRSIQTVMIKSRYKKLISRRGQLDDVINNSE